LSDDDLSVLKENILNECLKKSGHGPNKDAVYETPSEYDPFKVNMGQLTVYRFTLRCVCKVNPFISFGTTRIFTSKRSL